MVNKLYSDPKQVLQDKIAPWHNLLNERKTRINSLGAQYIHFWIPDKLSVYPEHVPSDFEIFPQTPVEIMLEGESGKGLQGIVRNLLPHLLESKQTHTLYWKTDTHWTYQGACSAYEFVCQLLSTTPRKELWNRPRMEIQRTLDLGSKLIPVVSENCHFANVLLHAHIVHKNELVKFIEILAPKLQGEMHLGASVTFENALPDCDKRTVLIFGDSYCEYRPTSLTALLAETFHSVHFVWSARVDFDLIDRLRPDIVITANAERFMSKVPEDNLELSGMVYNSIASFLNNKCRSATDHQFRWTYIKE